MLNIIRDAMIGPVRSVSLAFAILRLLARSDGALTLSDIVRATGTSPSSCLNILRTLVAEGALEVVGKKYALAGEWQGFAGLESDVDARFIARAQPWLSRFAGEQDVACGLWKVDRQHRVELVALGESRAAMRIHMAIGQRQPPGAGAIGRVLAAHEGLGTDEQARRFAGLRWHSAPMLPDYLAQIGTARITGFGTDDGHSFAGMCSIACVVPDEPVRYCLSATMFAGTREAEQRAVLGAALITLGAALAG